MAELVDAPDLGSGVERRGGSSPPPGTISFLAYFVAGISSRFPSGNELPSGLRILPGYFPIVRASSNLEYFSLF